MIDENDTVKITDLVMLPTSDDSFIVNTDDCSNYTITTTISPDGSNGWVGFVTAAPQPTTLNFYDEGGQAVSIDFSTGAINLAPHMTTDTAAKLFWDRVMATNPLKGTPVPDNVTFECTLPVPPKTTKATSIAELPKTPEERALEAYTRAMKVVK